MCVCECECECIDIDIYGECECARSEYGAHQCCSFPRRCCHDNRRVRRTPAQPEHSYRCYTRTQSLNSELERERGEGSSMAFASRGVASWLCMSLARCVWCSWGLPLTARACEMVKIAENSSFVVMSRFPDQADLCQFVVDSSPTHNNSRDLKTRTHTWCVCMTTSIITRHVCVCIITGRVSL